MYLASIPNPGNTGAAPKFLHSDDQALIERWLRAENRVGLSIYDCPNPLKPGAARHGKESLAAIEELFWDIDFKYIVEAAEQVDARLAQLLLTPSLLVDSGHGRHPRCRLKEPIPFNDANFERACIVQEKLITYFAADPQVRPWSLLRRPGTLNSKYEPHVVCRILQEGPTVDLTELEELCELVEGAPLLTRKQQATNGHDRAEGEPRPADPVDVEAEFASICDGGSANKAQCRIIPSLLRKAMHPEDVLTMVVDGTMQAAERHGLPWTREAERRHVTERIKSMYSSLLLKDYDHTAGIIPDWLPGDFHAAWIERLQAGRRPTVCHAAHIGWHIRSFETKTDSPRDKSGTGIPYSQARAKTLELRPFKAFDVATLPPRSWLYGKHYQRKTVSLTAGPGGMGKSSEDLVEAIAMATARSLLGEQPGERLKCWYHNGEDNAQEIDRRIAAICQH